MGTEPPFRANRLLGEAPSRRLLYKKFVCYCKTNSGDLTAAIEAGVAKAPQVGSDIEEAEGEKAQLVEDLKTHTADRDAAKAMAPLAPWNHGPKGSQKE